MHGLVGVEVCVCVCFSLNVAYVHTSYYLNSMGLACMTPSCCKPPTKKGMEIFLALCGQEIAHRYTCMHFILTFLSNTPHNLPGWDSSSYRYDVEKARAEGMGGRRFELDNAKHADFSTPAIN